MIFYWKFFFHIESKCYFSLGEKNHQKLHFFIDYFPYVLFFVLMPAWKLKGNVQISNEFLAKM